MACNRWCRIRDVRTGASAVYRGPRRSLEVPRAVASKEKLSDAIGSRWEDLHVRPGDLPAFRPSSPMDRAGSRPSGAAAPPEIAPNTTLVFELEARGALKSGRPTRPTSERLRSGGTHLHLHVRALRQTDAKSVR
jgi:hypothetical protein